MRIDLNSDMGESFGAYSLGQDAQVLAHISSANIACGFHAGDPQVMRRTVAMAAARGVAVGAHPGYPDLVGFGRREMACSPDEVTDFVLYQIGAIAAMCRAEGARLHHVKPHGALYNQAARDPALAGAIAAAVRTFDPALFLFAQPGSRLAEAGAAAGLPVAYEAFADRAYNPDGSLVSRRLPGAILHDPAVIVPRLLRLVREGRLQAHDGRDIALEADTICVHGDNAAALAISAAVSTALVAAGVTLAAPGR